MKLKLIINNLTILFFIFILTGVNLNSEDNISIKSVSITDDRYVIDSALILSNRNLDNLINKIEESELEERTNITQIPKFIFKFINDITNEFTIANPNEKWQVGCVVFEELPRRKFEYFGLGSNVALMTYKSGGIGTSTKILIFHFDNDKIIDFWCGNKLKDLKNIDEIIAHLIENKDKKWGLNTNVISLYYK